MQAVISVPHATLNSEFFTGGIVAFVLAFTRDNLTFGLTFSGCERPQEVRLLRGIGVDLNQFVQSATPEVTPIYRTEVYIPGSSSFLMACVGRYKKCFLGGIHHQLDVTSYRLINQSPLSLPSRTVLVQMPELALTSLRKPLTIRQFSFLWKENYSFY